MLPKSFKACVSLLKDKKLTFIDPKDKNFVDGFLSVTEASNIVIFTRYWDIYEALSPFYKTIFSSWIDQECSADIFIISHQKGKLYTKLNLKMCSSHSHQNSLIFLFGYNTDGIKSFKKIFNEIIGPPLYQESAGHAQIYGGKNLSSKKASLADFKDSYSYTYLNKALSITNYPGVFSFGELDHGTAFLLDYLKDKGNDHSLNILDFGCGSGIITACLGLLYPNATIDAVDHFSLSLQSTIETTDQLKQPLNIYPTDGFSKIDKTYDLIISNPPFHKGTSISYGTTTGFLSEVKKRLNKKGSLIIVANVFLKYEPLMEEIGPTEKIMETKSFKILKTICN